MDPTTMNQGGFLDQLKNKVTETLGGSGAEHSGLIDSVLKLVNDSKGGLGGLISTFQDKGMGGIISSWVGTGENQPVSGDQVASALGSEKIDEIAGKLGMSADKVKAGLASVLPVVIDKLTPDGKVPELPGAGLLEGLAAKAKSMFKQT
ncbi:MAG TPA: YidB family protein [Myxococcales bacterium]